MFKKYKARKQFRGGLKPLKLDARDLSLGIFGWQDYKPLAPEVDIKTLSVKDQGQLSTCTFQAGTVKKEMDANVVLSARFAATMGKRFGLVGHEGLSDLRTVQKITQQYGICEEKLLPSTNLPWENYSDYTKVTPQILANAGQHKSQSYWSVSNVNQVLKLLDEGRTVTIGIDWKQAWNMNGGFSIPWLISMIGSFIVGGHAVLIRGYKKNYQGIPIVLKIQNSYGFGYGDGGCFYMKPEDLQPYLNKYGAFTQLDINVDVGKFIVNYSNKVVKESDNANCYKILQGKKCLIPDVPTLWAWGILSEQIETVDKATLDAVPTGESLKFSDGERVTSVKAFAQYLSNVNGDERKIVLEQLKNYFSD